MTIKIRLIGNSMPITQFKQGDWIDLRNSEEIIVKAPIATTLKRNKVAGAESSKRTVEFSTVLIPLGVVMKLPKGYEAVVLPRSSTLAKFGIIAAHSQGVIDNAYCGDSDQWFFPAIGLRDTVIGANTRICQFRIQLSQNATKWQKIKWLFTSKIKFIYVDKLNNRDRGGFGSTGQK